MPTSSPLRSLRFAALALAGLLTATACGATDTGEGGAPAANVAPTMKPDPKAPLYDDLPENIRKAGTIKLGSAIDYPPFESYEEDGKTLKGFEVDLSRALEKELGVPFTWNNAGFDSLLPSLTSGRYDIVYGAVNDTAERRKSFDFVDYLRSSQAFVSQPGNPKGIKTPDDLCGKAIAAVRGGVQAEYLEKRSGECTKAGKPKVDVLTFDGNSGEQLAVRQGRAAAMLENYPTAVTFAKESEGALELVPNLQVEKAYFGMVLPKDNTELRDALAKAWQEIIDNGEYGKVLAKWQLGDIALKKALVNTEEPEKKAS